MSANQQLAGVTEDVQMQNKNPAIVVMSPNSSQRCTHKAGKYLGYRCNDWE